ncbi:MAG: hypothetical protein OEX19_00015 [Gammaproteobacteria bacterium]|nr:hypothetical protein [Gammaproteobacteria bacterium]
MKLVRILKRVKPLFFDGDELIVAKNQKIFRLGTDGKLRILFSFENSLLYRVLEYFNLIFRLRRAGIYTSCKYHSNYYFCYQKKLFRFDVIEKQITLEKYFSQGHGPLQFCCVDSLSGFEDGVYFGEYFGNADKDEISIFQRKPDGQWVTVYTFPKGIINHIHALVPDRKNKCIWILVGDHGSSASIWRATDCFNDVVCIKGDNQQYRSCVAFPTEKGLLYATDTQYEENHIRLLELVEGDWRSKEIFPINGSCIFGCELKDYYIFSTSTEPAVGGQQSKIKQLFDSKPGPGILHNASYVVACKKNDFSCKVVYSREKDFLPYRLFQFGTIMFPNGSSKSNQLFAYNVGSKSCDLSTETWEIDF